jgi:hypothetical protein
MQPDPVIHRRRIAAMQSSERFQPEQPYNPFGTQYKLLCFGMLSTFVGDLERYQRWQKRQGKKVSACVKNQNENIHLDYRSALRWVKDRSDYFLSLDECCEACGIDPDVFLGRFGLD